MVLPNYVTEREPERLGLAMKPIDDLLSEMMARNASDLHIKAGSPPVIRVDGELVLLDEPPLTPEDTKDVAASIMTDKQIRRFSEHNEIDFAYSAANLGRFRVNVFHQRGSISVAMRQVTTKIPSFEELHLPRDHQAPGARAARPGAGHRHHRLGQDDHAGGDDRPHQQHQRRHIVTVEDPIEVLHKDKKSHHQPARDRARHRQLRRRRSSTSLRQDPDVILIGEMRDPETVSAALTAAQTGHLVLSTLHTIDATETINRIIDFFPPLPAEAGAHHAGRRRSRASSRSVCSCAPTAGRVPAVEIMVMTGRSATSSSTRSRRIDHRRRHRRGRLLRHADVRPVRCSACTRTGLITLADAIWWPATRTTSSSWCSRRATT